MLPNLRKSLFFQLQWKRTIKVYTKTGDKGTSQLYNGERRNKDDLVFQALGSTDELNAQIGVARVEIGNKHPELAQSLEKYNV